VFLVHPSILPSFVSYFLAFLSRLRIGAVRAASAVAMGATVALALAVGVGVGVGVVVAVDLAVAVVLLLLYVVVAFGVLAIPPSPSSIFPLRVLELSLTKCGFRRVGICAPLACSSAFPFPGGGRSGTLYILSHWALRAGIVCASAVS
jgi:hypothetical protein